MIILDPVNRDVIDAALAKGVRNYIGGNCTVSLMMMALAGLLPARPGRVDDVHDLPGGLRRRRAEHARAAAADGRGAPRGARACSTIPHSAILDIDREVAGILRDERFPTEHFGVPLAGSLIPWIDKDLGNGMSREEWKGGAETNKILGRDAGDAIPVDSICVRIGAMRCHSQALTIKLRRDVPLAEIEAMLAGAQRLGARRSQHARREHARADAGRGHRARSRFRSAACASSRWAPEYLGAFTVGDQLLWGAAEPLRRMLRILLAR